jgi:hypothetical protein
MPIARIAAISAGCENTLDVVIAMFVPKWQLSSGPARILCGDGGQALEPARVLADHGGEQVVGRAGIRHRDLRVRLHQERDMGERNRRLEIYPIRHF